MGDTWAEEHHALAKRFLEKKIADAITLELPLAGKPGFLTREEIQTVLMAAIAVVQVYQPERDDA